MGQPLSTLRRLRAAPTAAAPRHSLRPARLSGPSWLPSLALVAGLLPLAGMAQSPGARSPYPVTPTQRATAQQVAQAGVPLAEIAPGAPDTYTVKSGDTLWAIAGLYLRRPWRWPELWGMNLQEISNPHLIYPGQRLELVRDGDRARLRLAGTAAAAAGAEPPTVKLAPRTRSEALPDLALPTLRADLIEPFLVEPMVITEEQLARAPRLVSASDSRVLITRGDRAYARGPADAPMLEPAEGTTPSSGASPAAPVDWVVVRGSRVLRDPASGQPLGLEVQTVGRARLVRGESPLSSPPVPASLDIISARQELRVGDRLLPVPPRQFVSYSPRAPQSPLPGAQVLAVYGDAVSTVGQNQVLVINKGAADGLASGHVLAVLQEGRRVTDRVDGQAQVLQLPDERNGLLMVFRAFDRVAYALVLDTRQGVKVGDRLVSPR